MEFSIPAGCLAVMDRLAAHGFSAHLVGGCVRDLCRGVSPNDYDLTTSAAPDEMKRAFAGLRVIETGILHGTLTVLSDGVAYEVTTYRVEGAYSDGRHPDSVSFTASLREDLARRDFTVNAMSYSPKDGLTDPFGGLADLSAGIIRAVGDPDRRFTEDALRILRALRFSSTLGFAIEDSTAAALVRLAPTVCRVSPERIREELLKLLAGKSCRGVLTAYRDALFSAFPALSLIGEDWEDAASAASRLSSDPTLALAALARPLKETGVAALFRALKFDRKSERRASSAVAAYGAGLPVDLNGAGDLLVRFGAETTRDALALAEACRDPISETARSAVAAFLDSGRPYALSGLAVRGDDLATVGIPAGPERKETLFHLLSLVAEAKLKNEKQALLTYLDQK